jgi:two-component system, LytTR family, response regulator
MLKCASRSLSDEMLLMPQHSTVRPIRVLVVDDEPLSRRNVLALLRGDTDIASISECDSGHRAIQEIRSGRPDLVFLDVQMPECNGFDVLEMLGTAVPPAIIFVTAHDAYALRAFDVGALDYLLKPFDAERFGRALDRAKSRISQTNGPASGQPVRDIRFIVRSRGSVRFVSVSDIDWIEAADYYAQLHLPHESHLLRKSLAELERELEPCGFCRIHRSRIVNLERVRALEWRADGEYEAVLKGGTHLRVSRRFRKTLQERLVGLATSTG